MSIFLLILELIGTIAFSVSGAMTAMKKNMDIFGVMILGLTTAVGGGVIRDLILGITPPATFRDPRYAFTALVTAALVFLPWVRRLFQRYHRIYDLLMLVMDSVGLGIFTVIGVQAAFAQSGSYSMFLLTFVGVITGVGGGVLRDVLAGNTPYVFVKHIYACASLAGALVCAGLWTLLPPIWAMNLGAAVVILIRGLSAHFRWSLPRQRICRRSKNGSPQPAYLCRAASHHQIQLSQSRKSQQIKGPGPGAVKSVIDPNTKTDHRGGNPLFALGKLRHPVFPAEVFFRKNDHCDHR